MYALPLTGLLANQAAKSSTGRSDASAINWPDVATVVTGRTAKACRERWRGYLDPSVKRDPWDEAEDTQLTQLHNHLGNRWAMIAQQIIGRTADQVTSTSQKKRVIHRNNNM